MNILTKIQKELKVPKSQRNTFANYNYRNCEDILEAVKPLLGDAVLTVSDDIVQLGDRYYVKATATLKAGEETYSVSAFAREPLDKKGSDASQITGAASSYARKYALNGLFLIDDTKDSDSHDNRPSDRQNAPLEPRKPVSPTKTPEQAYEDAKRAILASKSIDELVRVNKRIEASTNIGEDAKIDLAFEYQDKMLTFDPTE